MSFELQPNMRETNLLADIHPPICAIPSREAFAGLSDDEKLYAHFMCRASFKGTRILFNQTSYESEGILEVLLALYETSGGNWETMFLDAGVDNEYVDGFLDYAAMFFANVGNYRSTNDIKFIPRIPKTAMEKLCEFPTSTKIKFKAVADYMYDTIPCRYGYSVYKECASGYYPTSSSITEEEVAAVQKLMQTQSLLPENTRISKISLMSSSNPSTSTSFVLRIASADASWKPQLDFPLHLELPGKPQLHIETEDHCGSLRKVVEELQHAKRHTTDEVQQAMIDFLVKSFETGDHRQFQSAQESWVRNHSPNVETVIGFIETYQDPFGVRGAWEGIVAIVNKTQSKKFSQLVERSSEFIPLLPWNGLSVGLPDGKISELESSNFLKPDFTSLDTLGFVKSESPAGLNLPNFEEICQNVGSKNLQFGNVNNANPTNEEMPFISKNDLPILRKYREKAFEVVVACHELLGHGSGRLFVESSPGNFNFDTENLPINPLTNKPINSWYKPGESWHSVFGSNANAIEECRADGVALLLLTHRSILEIFGFTDKSEVLADDIIHAGYLNFVYAATKGLARWNPVTKKWGQSHSRGQFALLRCMMESRSDFIRMKTDNGGLEIFMDPTKIISHAIPALKVFLQNLQAYRATANVVSGVEFFDKYSAVDATFEGYYPLVLKEQPLRIQYVQPNTFYENGNVRLKEYPATREGLIQSWVERDI